MEGRTSTSTSTPPGLEVMGLSSLAMVASIERMQSCDMPEVKYFNTKNDDVHAMGSEFDPDSSIAKSDHAMGSEFDPFSSQSTVASVSWADVNNFRKNNKARKSTDMSISTAITQDSGIDDEEDDDEWYTWEPNPDLTGLGRDSLEQSESVQQSLPSLGSALHSSSQCKPCAWFWKPQGCSHGKECHHCHLCPADELKSRKKAKAAAKRCNLQHMDPTPLSSSNASLMVGSPEPRHVALDVPSPDDSLPSKVATECAMLALEEQPMYISLPQGLSLPPGLENGPDGGVLLPQPSQGAALHGTGQCAPCAWFWKPQGCSRGQDCDYCHLCPNGELKARKKAKAAAIRLGVIEDNPGNGSPIQDAGQEVQSLDTKESTLTLDTMMPLPSTGSALHVLGKCRPCAWFWKEKGCANGQECCHCHLCPEGEIKKRKRERVLALRSSGKEQHMLEEDTRAPRVVSLASLL